MAAARTSAAMPQPLDGAAAPLVEHRSTPCCCCCCWPARSPCLTLRRLRRKLMVELHVDEARQILRQLVELETQLARRVITTEQATARRLQLYRELEELEERRARRRRARQRAGSDSGGRQQQ